jgi:nitrogenase molybdenum-iron protein alpha chain
MAINLKSTEVETREQRLGTIIAWDGRASDLSSYSGYAHGGCDSCGQGGGKLCEQTSPFTQATTCCEGTKMVGVDGVVSIQHSPIGCAANQSGSIVLARVRAARSGRTVNVAELSSICTNLQEDDMVFGGVEKLEQSIRDAWSRHRPRAIFISMSCATGIIGDDVDSVASRLEEELGIPIVPLHCEGFKSRHWSSGWDIASHGIARQIVRKRPNRQEDLINISHVGGEDVFTPMLKELGLRVNLVYVASTLEKMEQLSEAAATATMCYALSYLSTALEQEYGVPEIKAPMPYGVAGTDAWLREIARVMHREALAEAYIAREHERIGPQLEELRRKLKGIKGYVAAGSAYAHGLMSAVRELGVELDGGLSYHHDPVYDSRDPRQDTLAHLIDTYGDIPNFTVSNLQHFQAYAALQRSRPDFAIFRHGGDLVTLASRLGIPTISLTAAANTMLGYQGLLNLGESILSFLPNRKFYEDVASHTTFPYTDWALAQTDPFALSKQRDSTEKGLRYATR